MDADLATDRTMSARYALVENPDRHCPLRLKDRCNATAEAPSHNGTGPPSERRPVLNG